KMTSFVVKRSIIALAEMVLLGFCSTKNDKTHSFYLHQVLLHHYVVVCKPPGAVLFQTRHAVRGVVFSWVWSFVWNTPLLLGWGSYHRDTANVSYIIAKLQMAGSGGTAKAEMKVVWMVVMIVLAILLTWIPYASFTLSMIFIPGLHIDPVMASVPMDLAKSSTSFNPFIYISMNKQLRFRNFALPYLFCGKNPWATKTGSSEVKTTLTTISKSSKVSPI
uniref:Parapinopsin a n=1 Tax=Electrophorus electricus TaxID=8005 RepID=A0A4W4DU08_ELEEL